jgi:hypothetical protein
MGVRRCCIVVALLLLPAQAWAHLHKAGGRLAYAAVDGSLLSGFEASIEIMRYEKDPKPHDRETRWDSYFLDVGANWGPHDGVDRRQVAVLVGARGTRYLSKSFELFAEVTLGGVHTSDSPGASAWSLAAGIGGGFAVRLLRDDVWMRPQYTYLRLSDSDTDARNYHRVSVGVEFRFWRVKK